MSTVTAFPAFETTAPTAPPEPHPAPESTPPPPFSIAKAITGSPMSIPAPEEAVDTVDTVDTADIAGTAANMGIVAGNAQEIGGRREAVGRRACKPSGGNVRGEGCSHAVFANLPEQRCR